jgi:hypothetical protein
VESVRVKGEILLNCLTMVMDEWEVDDDGLKEKGKKILSLGKVLGPMDQKLAQSRKLDKRCWLWMFQASAVNVTRFGSTVRKLVPTRPSFYDERSFAEVVKEGAMARDTRKVVLDLGRDRKGVG